MKKRETKIEIPVLVLLCLAGLCVIIIAAGTLFAITNGTGKAGATESGEKTQEETGTRSFLETGRLRIELEAPEGGGSSVLVVKASIPYTKKDTTFQEELVKNLPEIKNIITGTFSSLNYEEIQSIGEKKLKKEIIDKINGILVLEKLKEIYFEEFIFFE